MFGRTSETWLIVGLGNPGREYEKTRHNAGFRALDILADKLGCKVDKAKFQGMYGQVTHKGRKLLLLKPLTYMNLSGRSVLQLSAFSMCRPRTSSFCLMIFLWSPGGCGFARTAPPADTTASSPSLQSWAVRIFPG